MKTSIYNIEGEIIIFQDEDSFIEFVLDQFKFNEDGDDVLKQPVTYVDCLFYLLFYCDDLKLQYTSYLKIKND